MASMARHGQGGRDGVSGAGLDFPQGQWKPQGDQTWSVLRVHFAPVKGTSEGPRMETDSCWPSVGAGNAVLCGAVGQACWQIWGAVGGWTAGCGASKWDGEDGERYRGQISVVTGAGEAEISFPPPKILPAGFGIKLT